MDVSRIPANVANVAIVPPAAAPAPRPAPVSASPKAASPAAGSSLWDLLTPEEQDFFTRQSALGPLTYGPSAKRRAAATPDHAPLGGRIDVKG
jgi:hypothetical protein